MNTVLRNTALFACSMAVLISSVACGSSGSAAAVVPTVRQPTQTPRIIRETTLVTQVVTHVVTATPEAALDAATSTTEAATAPTSPALAAQDTANEPPKLSGSVATATPTITAAPAGPEGTPASTGQVLNGGNMREVPGGAVLGQVCPGDTAIYLQSQDVWYQISIEQTAADCVPDRVKAGAVGWIHSSLLSVPTLAVPTSTPAPTAEVTDMSQVQQIGPIRDTLREESFTTEITLKQVRWVEQGDYQEPKPGHIFVVATLHIKNLGPSPLRSIGAGSLEVLDANGALDDYDLIGGVTDDCQLEIVDLIANGSIEGCVAFEVPIEGQVQLIYAPYQYEALTPGRYLSFMLRP